MLWCVSYSRGDVFGYYGSKMMMRMNYVARQVLLHDDVCSCVHYVACTDLPYVHVPTMSPALIYQCVLEMMSC